MIWLSIAPLAAYALLLAELAVGSRRGEPTRRGLATAFLALGIAAWLLLAPAP